MAVKLLPTFFSLRTVYVTVIGCMFIMMYRYCMVIILCPSWRSDDMRNIEVIDRKMMTGFMIVYRYRCISQNNGFAKTLNKERTYHLGENT